jgi:alkanesulfonate monooxygenase SsuD/methylene tetrahydromethanopterin reductase-like flavin-dependent oxidoreductase (luciferase family)
MVEQLQIIKGLWETPEGSSFSFGGQYYTLEDSPGLPKPAQRPRPPIIIGGTGLRRTPRVAAMHADEFNVSFMDVQETAVRVEAGRAACTDLGRDPGSLVYSVALTTCCGRDDAELKRRARAIGEDLDELRAGGLAGSPAEVVDRIGEYSQVGVSRIYLQILDLDDLAHMELIASEVLPHVG